MMMFKPVRPVQPFEGVLVANASRARLFERDAENGAMRETASFVHPQTRLKGQALGHDRPGHAHKGVASTAFQAKAVSPRQIFCQPGVSTLGPALASMVAALPR